MNRLFVNHLEAYLQFANKIFIMAIDTCKDEYNISCEGINLVLSWLCLL